MITPRCNGTAEGTSACDRFLKIIHEELKHIPTDYNAPTCNFEPDDEVAVQVPTEHEDACIRHFLKDKFIVIEVRKRNFELFLVENYDGTRKWLTIEQMVERNVNVETIKRQKIGGVFDVLVESCTDYTRDIIIAKRLAPYLSVIRNVREYEVEQR